MNPHAMKPGTSYGVGASRTAQIENYCQYLNAREPQRHSVTYYERPDENGNGDFRLGIFRKGEGFILLDFALMADLYRQQHPINDGDDT